jgi:hypothetical protein
MFDMHACLMVKVSVRCDSDASSYATMRLRQESPLELYCAAVCMSRGLW